MATLTLHAAGTLERREADVRLWLAATPVSIELVARVPGRDDLWYDSLADANAILSHHLHDQVAFDVLTGVDTSTTVMRYLDASVAAEPYTHEPLAVVTHHIHGEVRALGNEDEPGTLWIAIYTPHNQVWYRYFEALDWGETALFAYAVETQREVLLPAPGLRLRTKRPVPFRLVRVVRFAEYITIVLGAPEFNAQATLALTPAEYDALRRDLAACLAPATAEQTAADAETNAETNAAACEDQLGEPA